MKKKLLSLVLAGAMVASTSVSAFADDTHEVTSYEGTANVTVDGSVNADDDTPATGTVSVTVPTALSFQVSKKGVVTGTNITVTNNGMGDIDVYADRFTDNNPTSGITVKKKSDLQQDSDTRDNVVLWLRGNTSSIAYFKTEEDSSQNNNGVYDETGINQSGGIKVSSISGKGKGVNTDKLYLEGYGAKEELNDETAKKNGITDKFTLVLKIKKHDN